MTVDPVHHIPILPIQERARSENLTFAIEYRCADGRFLMSPRGVAIPNQNYLSSSETRVNASLKTWKSHLSQSNWCQESIGGICFLNKWRAASLRPLSFLNQRSNAGFSNASPGLTVRFLGGEHRGFLNERVKIYRMAPMSPLNSPTFFFICASIVYDICIPWATSTGLTG
jgi:hypothetical protein